MPLFCWYRTSQIFLSLRLRLRMELAFLSAISDWKIITPESCVSAKVGGNITCTHEGFGGITPCTFAICSPTKVQEIGPTDIMSFKFNEPYPKNFTFTLDVQSSFSFIPIATMNETYYCNLNGDNVDSYNCSKI